MTKKLHRQRFRCLPAIASMLLTVAIWLAPSVGWAQSGTRLAPARSTPAGNASAATGTVPAKTTGVAVVELFTSQGCSSCPPADAALRQVDAIAQQNKLPVYALSFHVDYWNRLGWTDPYSDALFSKRQSAYASASGSSRVYTPQMIVNGTTEFVGSDKAKAHAAITKALGRRPTSQIALQIDHRSTKGQLAIRFNVAGATGGSVLNVALVQTPAANHVPNGENAGRKLAHVNVVRAFQTVRLDDAAGSVNLRLPDDVDASKAEVVAYVQNTKTRSISGATSASAD